MKQKTTEKSKDTACPQSEDTSLAQYWVKVYTCSKRYIYVEVFAK